MKLVAFGDSFTYGEELSDLNNAWPHLLARKLGCSCDNLGEKAASNDTIVRKIMDYSAVTDTTDTVYAIGWTFPGRTEFADDKGFFSIWPGYLGKMFIADGQTWRSELCEYIAMHHNTDALYYKYLHQVILVQAYLKSKNIKYVMLNVCHNEYYKNQKIDKPSEIAKFTNQVDLTNYIDFNIAGMCEWVYRHEKLHGQLPSGPNGHFLDEGHAIVANKIYEAYFRN